MEKAKLVNKRKHPRLRIAIPVRFKVFTKAKDYQHLSLPKTKQAEGRSANLSRRGISLITRLELQRNDFLKLEFELPEYSRRLEAYATVAWCKDTGEAEGEYEAGLYLLNIKQKDENLISRFIVNKVRGLVSPLFHG